ncbi:nitrate reductase [Duffyella gerundensis]|uniref:nitrate reductase n=1 Tax=Duffyella gerundensis TaxID=1619313 RepID=UPI0021F6AB59|nr:nitrate reductase [Duffyella gerundensis]
MNSTCPYCGVGCGVTVTSRAGAVQVSGDGEHPANAGRLCVKGAALADTLGETGRLRYPHVNGSRVSWETALDAVASGLQQVIDQHGPQAVAFYASGQLLTEDYYVANKLMKGFIGAGNIDTNSRLCMASAVVGYKRAFGADAVPCSYADLDHADLVILCGSNTAWAHPVLWQRLVQAKLQRPAMQVVVIDPRRTASCDIADVHLALRAGSDAALFNGLLHWLAQQGTDSSMLPHLADVPAALDAASNWSPAQVAAYCQLSEEQVTAFYRAFASQRNVLTLYCMGINQSTSGSDKCNAIINCHLLSGKIGRNGSGPFSLTGQPNAMGGREVGGLATQLAAHMDFSAENVARLQRFWGSERVAQQPGLSAVALFDAVARGEVKAIWIMGTNPAVSLPEASRVRQALARCPLVIVSDVAAQTDTTELAHICLPAAAWGEKNGTVTNSERRISRQRAFVPPVGEARPDWWILAQVAQRLGFHQAFAWHHPAEIFCEHAALSGFENHGSRAFDISGLASLSVAEWDRLLPVQWPVNASAPQGTARLFSDRRFFHPDGRARLIAVTPRLPLAACTTAYPLLLNTGRIRDQWHTMTRTGQVPRLMQHVSEPYVAMHPQDAADYQLQARDLVRVQSSQGWMIARAVLTDDQPVGTLFAPMHWNRQFAAQSSVGALVAVQVCPLSGQPESKQTAVQIARWQSHWQGTLFSHDNVTFPDGVWWSRIPHTHATRYQLAGSGPLSALLSALDLNDMACQRMEGTNELRLLAWRDGELMLALWVGPRVPELDLAFIDAAFASPPTCAADRHALLGGRATERENAGRTVCSCFGTGEQTILCAVAAGDNSLAALGARLKCGTNCGSCIPELKQLIARFPAHA